MSPRTQIETATDTLRSLLAHLEALAEMGVPLHIPTELADSCQKIARLAEIPVAKANTEAAAPAQKVAEPWVSSLNDEVSTRRVETEAPHLGAVAGAATRESEAPPRTTIREAVLAAVQPGEEVSARVVLGRLEAAGVVANRDTVSNELSRYTNEGMLERPARGTYRLRTLTVTDPALDHEPLAALLRPTDQEGMGGDAAIQAEGAVM